MADITIPREAKEAANKIEYLMRLHDDMSDTIEALRAEVETLKAARDLVLEEAARVVRRMPSPSSEWMADELLRALGGPANQVPEDIRALKNKTGDTP